MRISDWSSDVCSSDLQTPRRVRKSAGGPRREDAPDFPGEGGQRGHDLVILHRARLRIERAQGAVKAAVVEIDRQRAIAFEAVQQIGRASCRARVWRYV